jgi:DMSO/TMAO reductase YedYZ molybdopterin-dependent catalytic subunit
MPRRLLAGVVATSAQQKGVPSEGGTGGIWHWSVAGGAAGLMMIAAMFVRREVSGAPALPELIEDQVLGLLPGALFAFVLDRLQFAAKPLLLVGLALLPVPVGAGLGWLYGKAWSRQRWFDRRGLLGGVAYGVMVWLVLELAVATVGDGLTAAITSAWSLLAVAEVYGIGMVGLARLLEPPDHAAPAGTEVVNPRRRALIVGGLTGGALVVAAGALVRMLASNTEQSTPLACAGTDAALASERTSAPALTPTAKGTTGLAVPSTSVAIPPGVADEITPNERFYVVSKNFNDPRVSADKWSLEVSGLVLQPRHFSHTEILEFSTVSQYTTLECISNTLGGSLMSNARWTGVPLGQLLASVGLQPAAQAVIFRSADNYYESFPLEVLMAPGVLLAHTMNGAPLPDKHGFPLRLVMPGRYGMKNPKWITGIEIVPEPVEGYWVRRGWDRDALVQTVVRIDTPADNASVAGSRLDMSGVAFAGTRGISHIEVSDDGGTTWREARSTPPLGSSTWVRWQ